MVLDVWPLLFCTERTEPISPISDRMCLQRKEKGWGWQRKRPAVQKWALKLVKCISDVTACVHVWLILAPKRRCSLCMFFVAVLKGTGPAEHRLPAGWPGYAGSPRSSSRLTAPFQPGHLRLVLQLGGLACCADTSKAWHSYSITQPWACSPAAATQLTSKMCTLGKTS